VFTLFYSFDESTMAEAAAENTTKKKISQSLVQRIVCPIPPGMAEHDLPTRGELHFNDGAIDLALPYEIRLIKMKRTEEEKRAARRLYTKEYIRRPDVRAKIQSRLHDPEKVKQRKEYASSESVKQRKRELNARNRAIRNRLKVENPELYNSLMARVIAN
jgi:hypothetical protein